MFDFLLGTCVCFQFQGLCPLSILCFLLSDFFVSIFEVFVTLFHANQPTNKQTPKITLHNNRQRTHPYLQLFYRVCHELSEMIIYESLLTTSEASIIFEAARAVAKIGSSLNPNHHNKIYQVRLVQIPDPLCSTTSCKPAKVTISFCVVLYNPQILSMSLHVPTLNTATNLRSRQYLNVVVSNKVSDKKVMGLACSNMFFCRFDTI